MELCKKPISEDIASLFVRACVYGAMYVCVCVARARERAIKCKREFRDEKQMEPRRPLLPASLLSRIAKCYRGRIVSRKHERDLRGDPPIVLPITEINAVDSAVVARHPPLPPVGVYDIAKMGVCSRFGGIREIISLPR